MSAVLKNGPADSRLTKEEAEEYTQSLGLIVGASWRQIELAKKLGVPQALGLEVPEWVEKRLGGYIRLSITDRREAVKELAGKGLSQSEIAEVVGVTQPTVSGDLNYKNLSKTLGKRADSYKKLSNSSDEIIPGVTKQDIEKFGAVAAATAAAFATEPTETEIAQAERIKELEAALAQARDADPERSEEEAALKERVEDLIAINGDLNERVNELERKTTGLSPEEKELRARITELEVALAKAKEPPKPAPSPEPQQDLIAQSEKDNIERSRNFVRAMFKTISDTLHCLDVLASSDYGPLKDHIDTERDRKDFGLYFKTMRDLLKAEGKADRGLKKLHELIKTLENYYGK